MSIFAGIYNYTRSEPLDKRIVAALRETIGRTADSVISEYSWPSAYMVHADIGAFGHQCHWQGADGGALVTAGQLLSDASLGQDRLPEIRMMTDSLSHEDTAPLRASRGTFALASYHPVTHHLALAVDRVGTRPLYYYDNGQQVIFSTLMATFETLASIIRTEVDLQAIIETNTFGFCLGTRTPFRGVYCFRGGECLLWSGQKPERKVYWRWDEQTDLNCGGDEAAKRLHAAFADAVEVRRGTDSSVRAFLSGGLDSRSVVTELKTQGLQVHTYNISWQRSYDSILGAACAKHLGALHHEATLPPTMAGWAWPRLMADTIAREDAEASGSIADRSRVIWSGDGGSVGLGRVYITAAMVQLLRAGDIDGCVKEMLSHNGIALCAGTFHPKQRKVFETSLLRILHEEIARHRCSDPGKAILLFFLENDQRRHMASFYEEIDRTRLEYQMPFFDGDFLAAAVSLPLDESLYHHFYVRHWMPALGNLALEVPWQAYPGHEPCHLALPEGALYQWRRPRAPDTRRRWKNLKTACRWCLSERLPTALYSRWRLLAAGMAATLNGSDYSYLFKSLDKAAYYSALCKK